MARPKIKRNSTNIDMTAMCDVAFLLLSFFILTTKFKPAEAVPITPPSSVSAQVAPSKDVCLINITKDGKVFIAIDDESKRSGVLNTLNTTRNLGLSSGEMAALAKQPFFGSSLAQLKQVATMPADKLTGDVLPGIPCKDSTNNEMIDWMRAVNSTYQGQTLNLLMKGDNTSKYPAFSNVIKALKKNDFLKFQMVTNPESVPAGTELYNKAMQGIKQADL